MRLAGLSAVLALLTTVGLQGCARFHAEGVADVPPGAEATAGPFVDVDPRWSPDGGRIAFLRSTPDRRYQLFLAGSRLDRPMALLEPELLQPDRGLRTNRAGYAAPESISWAPDDRRIAFERLEWFTFENGERLPGTGLWSLDTGSGAVRALALHPTHYGFPYYYYRTPGWSPDERYLSFVGEGINGQRVIFVRDLAAQSAVDAAPLFDGVEDSDWPAWELDEPHRLVYRRRIQRAYFAPAVETLRVMKPGAADPSSAGAIWKLSSAGYLRDSRAHGSAKPRLRAEDFSLRAGNEAWSRDGRSVAFTVTTSANEPSRYEVWVAGADGRKARRISPPNGRGYLSPVWIDADTLGALSPAGKGMDVTLLHLNRAAVSRLGSIASADCDWSPDRRWIVYAPSEGGPTPTGGATTLRLFHTGVEASQTQLVNRRGDNRASTSRRHSG